MTHLFEMLNLIPAFRFCVFFFLIFILAILGEVEFAYRISNAKVDVLEYL